MPRRTAAFVVSCVALALSAGCVDVDPDGNTTPGTTGRADPNGARGPGAPAVVVLGSAQDGGVPHAACTCTRCETARASGAFRRLAPALALVGADRRPWLVDASPDLATQMHAFLPAGAGGVERSPIAGVFLTHAHIGHYLGLAQLGREVVHARDVRVVATPAMSAFLSSNAPWSLLVRLGNIRLEPTEPGTPVDIGGGVRVTAFRVPHRDEFADTVGYRIEGPNATVLYVPDTDAWDTWDPPLETRLVGVDVALIDGTFYSLDELPGRSIDEVPHPLMTTSMDRLDPWVRAGGRVVFTHLNHSNPAVDPHGATARLVRERGFEIAADGLYVGL